jgi:hypothetical protein
MKKILLSFILLVSIVVLSACTHNNKNFGEMKQETADNLVITDKDKLYQISLPKEYAFNNEAEIESLSYGYEKRELYVLVLWENKKDISATTIDEYFDLISPNLDNKQVEKLPSNIIKNPKNYKVQDYKITGSYGGAKLVRYQRIIDQDDYFVQYNAWTLPSKEQENQSELFANIEKFIWLWKESNLSGTSIDMSWAIRTWSN